MYKSGRAGIKHKDRIKSAPSRHLEFRNFESLSRVVIFWLQSLPSTVSL